MFHNHVSSKFRLSPIVPVSNPTVTCSSPCPSTKTNYSETTSKSSPCHHHSESSGPSLEELSVVKPFPWNGTFPRLPRLRKSILSAHQTTKSPPLPLNVQWDDWRNSAIPPSTLFPSIPYYYHGDMQFISSLIAVSERLVTLNRSNRLKALHAELCLINHNLPAPICVHSWCSNPRSSSYFKYFSVWV